MASQRGSPNEIRAALLSAAALPLFPVAFVVWHGKRARCCIEPKKVSGIDNQVEPPQLDLHSFHPAQLAIHSRVEPVSPNFWPENLVEPTRFSQGRGQRALSRLNSEKSRKIVF